MFNHDINWQPKILEDDILKIIPLHESDFNALYEVASDPLIWEQHPVKDRYKKEVFQEFFDGAIAGNMAFVLVDKFTNTIIGSTRYYDYKSANSCISIGYTFLARHYWGGSYNKASKKLLLNHAFQFVDEVLFHIGAGNVRSQIAMERLGGLKFKEEETTNAGETTLKYFFKISKTDYYKTH